jgi:hypothetical protein
MGRKPFGSGKTWAALAVALLLGGCDYFRERLTGQNLSIKDTREATGGKPAPSRSAAAGVTPARGVAMRSPDMREAAKEPATPATATQTTAIEASGKAALPTAEVPKSYGYKPSEPATTAPGIAPAAEPPATPDEQKAPSSRLSMGAIGLPRSPDSPKPDTDAKAISYHLLEEGRRLFLIGRVIDARARLYAGIDSSTPDVMLTLARTFDPFYLRQLDTSDGTPNVERAISLYERAKEQGSTDAGRDLERIKKDRGAPPRH